MAAPRAKEHLNKAYSLLQSAITNSPIAHPDYSFYLAEVLLEKSKLSKSLYDRDAHLKRSLEYFYSTINNFEQLSEKVS